MLDSKPPAQLQRLGSILSFFAAILAFVLHASGRPTIGVYFIKICMTLNINLKHSVHDIMSLHAFISQTHYMMYDALLKKSVK